MSTPSPRRRYAVLVPVKPPGLAKSRLSPLGDAARTDLAAAFAGDSVAAALSCPDVARVLVVTDDHVLARSMSDLGAEVIPDGADGLNATLVQAAAEMHRRDPELGIVALCADVCALRPDELSLALQAADPDRMSFGADEQRVGTTALIAPTADTFTPAFGEQSRARHREAGAFEVDGIDVPTLRRDVDSPADLEAARALGVGPRTALVLTLLNL
jgi:2-phospho-L-lactate guanylyltransferase